MTTKDVSKSKRHTASRDSGLEPDAPGGTGWTLELRDYKGTTWIVRTDDGQFTPLATGFRILSGLRFVDLDDRAVLQVQVCTEEDLWVVVDIDAGELVERGGTSALAKLRRAGLRMSKQGLTYVLQTLMETQPRGGRRYHRGGFRDHYFIPPIGPALFSNGADVALADGVRLDGLATKGSLEAWKRAAAYICALDADALQAGLVGGVIGPVVDLLQLDAPSFIFEGPTSSGKSTAQALAAGAWASPVLGEGLLISLKGTANSYEVALERGSGTLAALDEAHNATAGTVTDLAFTTQGGSGKARLDSSGNPRRRRQFRTPLFMSAETQHTQRLRAEGLTAPGGLSVRMLAISTTGMPKLTREQWASIQGALDNFGHYGPEFVVALDNQNFIAEPERLRSLLESHVDTFEGVEDPMKRRACYGLALMATAQEISKTAGLLPQAANPLVFHKIWRNFLNSTMAPRDPTERAIEHLRERLVALRGIEIVEVGEDRAAREAAGYIMETKANRVADWGERVYVVRATELSRLSGGIADDTALRRALAREGIAIREPSKKTPITWSSFPGRAKAMYLVLRADMIEAEEGADYGGAAEEPAKVLSVSTVSKLSGSRCSPTTAGSRRTF